MVRRRRRIVGVLPRLGRAAVAFAWWLIRHPRPMIAAALLVGAGWSLTHYSRRADAFRIARVMLDPGSSLQVPATVIGQNLWRLDIRGLAESLHAQQPWLKRVRVIREPPQTIRIDTIARRPIAQVRLRRWYPIDHEGFVLPQGSPEPLGELTRVAGLEPSGTSLVIGAVNEAPQLTAALRVLATLRRHPALTGRTIAELDVAEPRQLRFVVGLAGASGAPGADGGLVEVRCGAEETLDVQLERLRTALKVMATQGMEARYVDVRFEEPVIGPRT